MPCFASQHGQHPALLHTRFGSASNDVGSTELTGHDCGNATAALHNGDRPPMDRRNAPLLQQIADTPPTIFTPNNVSRQRRAHGQRKLVSADPHERSAFGIPSHVDPHRTRLTSEHRSNAVATHKNKISSLPG
jgi:hypothetical protein